MVRREAAVEERGSLPRVDGLLALQPIEAPRSLVDDAAERLREQILSGNLRRGTHLVEAKLASRLNVSRGTIRAAFQALIADGLAREEPRRGVFVVSLERDDVREIYDVRAAVEGRAADLVARRSGPGAVVALRPALDGIAAAARDGDRAALRRADLAFHARICELSGNLRLLEIFNRYVPVVQTLLTYDQLVYPSPEQTEGEHRAIFDAISDGDGERAAREVADHCERARDRLIRYFDEEPSG